jgi:BirA family biotin operon repressor/biotin-[acetyl-CoA-carboxylase] ligase
VKWQLTVVAETGSTNADLLRSEGPEGTVLAARSQTAGRGRLGRSWVSPPGKALTFSVLLRPGDAIPPARRGWLPLAAGLAVASAVREVAGVSADLKWPNDVLHDSRKLAGILAEQSPSGAVVIGIGLNVSASADELPSRGPGALEPTSLLIAGAGGVLVHDLLTPILGGLGSRYAALRGGGSVRDEYLSRCATLGRSVRVELPGARFVEGEAADVDDFGHLLVRLPSGAVESVSAGDVVHLR